MSAMRHGAERRSGNAVTSSTSRRVALDSTRWGWGRSSGERHSDSDGLGQSEHSRGGAEEAEARREPRTEVKKWEEQETCGFLFQFPAPPQPPRLRVRLFCR